MTPSEAGRACRRLGRSRPEGDRRTSADKMERSAANGAPGCPDGAGGNGGGPGQKAPQRRRPGAARRGRAQPGGPPPAGPSPASGRSLRPPQPCGPGSGRGAAACPGPERGGGALWRRAEHRLRRGATRNRNPGRTAQPASASGLRTRWWEGL